MSPDEWNAVQMQGGGKGSAAGLSTFREAGAMAVGGAQCYNQALVQPGEVYRWRPAGLGWFWGPLLRFGGGT